MEKMRWLALFLVMGLVCPSCKVVLNVATKNLKKKVVVRSFDGYDLSVHVNLSTGCPQSSTYIKRDTIVFGNCFVPSIIQHLTDKSMSRLEFVNMKIQKEMKLDVKYYSKRDVTLQANKDTLLKVLGKLVRFNVEKDTAWRKVYEVQVINAKRLREHLDKGPRSVTRLGTHNFECYAVPLSMVYDIMEDNLKVLIEHGADDAQRYTLMVPRGSVEVAMAYLRNDCGIELIEKKKRVEIARVTFENLD